MYAQSTNKRQKTINSRETARNLEANDYFPGLNRVEFHADAAYEDTLTYQYYNATERIHGRAMEDWLRPCISFRNAFCHSGGDYPLNSTLCKSWDDGSHTEENYKRRLKAAFELYSKLGVKYWTLYDTDIAPEGDTLEETHHFIDESTQVILDLQQRTGIKPLWVAADLRTNCRYVSGAVTSPEAYITGYAGAQLKKALDIAHKLGAENFLFKGFYEGYTSILNTDIPRELRIYSRVLKMIVDYKERLGYRGQLLLEPCYNYDNSKNHDNFLQHNYMHSITSALSFLKHYNLDRHYKLSVPPGDQLYMAAAYGFLGSIDATNLKHLSDISEATLLFKTVIEQGGIQPGGLNIGVSLARESTETKDLFIAYVQQIDRLARGLRNAVKIVEDGLFNKNLQQRYLSFHTGFGSRIASGEATLEDCEDQARKTHGETVFTSGRTEHWEAVFNRYV
ncbi:uncharacterized protein LOC126175306 [Schistocerca cancellata]|uniref:uncharacterized protein LOC126175306 n=1 Tax=Schistocerca cancellata TaxID=274614 RepID=UPI002119ABF2|nr:uncharacterized protein LOC126175306 [Schistocerca cancellata]